LVRRSMASMLPAAALAISSTSATGRATLRRPAISAPLALLAGHVRSEVKPSTCPLTATRYRRKSGQTRATRDARVRRRCRGVRRGPRHERGPDAARRHAR
jgi:hypothetical protein